MFSQFRVDKPTWNIVPDQDWSGYTKAVSNNVHKIDPSSVQSLSNSITAVVHQSLREGIGVKSSVRRKNPPRKLRALPFCFFFFFRTNEEVY